MSTEYSTAIPMISYEDGIAALEWLAKAFGFRERVRQIGEDGKLSHGEMDAGDGIIMLATPTPDYESPSHHRETCEQARKWSAVPWIIDGVLVYVDDLDAHFAREGSGSSDSFRDRGGFARAAVSSRRPGGPPLVLHREKPRQLNRNPSLLAACH